MVCNPSCWTWDSTVTDAKKVGGDEAANETGVEAAEDARAEAQESKPAELTARDVLKPSEFFVAQDEAVVASAHGDVRAAVEQAKSEGRDVVVICEGMGRVREAASELGADFFSPTGKDPTKWARNNEEWINRQMRNDALIIDIWQDKRGDSLDARSPYYMVERRQIARRNYNGYYWYPQDQES